MASQIVKICVCMLVEFVFYGQCSGELWLVSLHSVDFALICKVLQDTIVQKECMYPRSCKMSETLYISWFFWLAGCRSALSMSKIKVKISETKFLSFYKTLHVPVSFLIWYNSRKIRQLSIKNNLNLSTLFIMHPWRGTLLYLEY